MQKIEYTQAYKNILRHLELEYPTGQVQIMIKALREEKEGKVLKCLVNGIIDTINQLESERNQKAD